MMKRKMIILTILSAMLGGCRTHEYCEYKSVRKEMLGGRLAIGVRSEKINYKEGRKNRARHGFPYRLWIQFSVDLYSKYSESKFVLGQVKATGVETGKVLLFEGGEDNFTMVRSPNKEDWERPGCSGFGFPITENMGVTYEPFDIEADVKIIHADGTEQSEHIKVRLEKDYKKKRQSDTWDYLRSM